MFLYGFLLGIVIFAIHLSWLFLLLVSYTNYVKIYAVFLWILTVVWFAVFTGLWFYIQSCFYKKYNHIFGFISSWLILTVLYFYFMVYCSLWICGSCEGYPFFNPLVLLAYWPPLLWCLQYIGFCGGIAAIMCIILGFICGLRNHRRYYILSLFGVAPFLCGLLCYKPHIISISNVAYIKPWWYETKNPMYAGYRMVHDVTTAFHHDQSLQYIIMPESTFGWDLSQYDQFLEMMSDYSLTATILFGTQKRIDSNLFNCYVGVQNNNIVFNYSKQHLVPLMEYVPWFFDRIGFGEILCDKKDVFVCGDVDQDDTIIIDGIRFQLFICSELLCEKKAIKGIPILFVCNDMWFRYEIMKKWIALFVTYIRMRYAVPVIFVTVSGLYDLNN